MLFFFYLPQGLSVHRCLFLNEMCHDSLPTSPERFPSRARYREYPSLLANFGVVHPSSVLSFFPLGVHRPAAASAAIPSSHFVPACPSDKNPSPFTSPACTFFLAHSSGMRAHVFSATRFGFLPLEEPKASLFLKDVVCFPLIV